MTKSEISGAIAPQGAPAPAAGPSIAELGRSLTAVQRSWDADDEALIKEPSEFVREELRRRMERTLRVRDGIEAAIAMKKPESMSDALVLAMHLAAKNRAIDNSPEDAAENGWTQEACDMADALMNFLEGEAGLDLRDYAGGYYAGRSEEGGASQH